MDGFIDRVGTQFQSAIADLNGAAMMATRTKGRSHSRQILWAMFFIREERWTERVSHTKDTKSTKVLLTKERPEASDALALQLVTRHLSLVTFLRQHRPRCNDSSDRSRCGGRRFSTGSWSGAEQVEYSLDRS